MARSTQTAGQLSGNGERDEGDEAKDRADNDDGDDGPVFSLVDGTYKSRKVFGSRRKPGLQGNGTGTGVKGAEDGIRDLTVRNKEFSLARLESAGSEFRCGTIPYPFLSAEGLQHQTPSDGGNFLEVACRMVND